MKVPSSSAVTSTELVHTLSRTIDDTLNPLIPSGARVALLDFPNHNNVGDNAIWLGEIAYLERRSAETVYTCDLSNYCPRTLRERLGDGIVLLHGGGSFGTIWPRHQAFRERIVREFPGHKIVQLPQTVDFTDALSLERARQALQRHPDLTILARDHESLAQLEGELGLAALLCPDMAFALGTFDRFPPKKDILWLARSDRESMAQPPAKASAGVEVVDWLRGEPGRPWSHALAAATVRSRRLTNAAMEHLSPVRRIAGPALSATFDWLAWRRFQRGCRILSRGQVVITDRLHGHIMSLLLGLPHVLLDNRFGKLRRFHRSFTSESDSCRLAPGPEAALEIAFELLRGADRP